MICRARRKASVGQQGCKAVVSCSRYCIAASYAETSSSSSDGRERLAFTWSRSPSAGWWVSHSRFIVIQAQLCW